MPNLAHLSHALDRLKKRLKSSKFQKEDSLVRQATLLFLEDERVGGPKGISQYWAETHEMARTSDSLRYRRDWAVWLQTIFQAYDDLMREEPDMDPEEAHLVMVAELVEEIRREPEFAKCIVIEAIRSLQNANDTAAMGDLQNLLGRVVAGEDALPDQKFVPAKREDEEDTVEELP